MALPRSPSYFLRGADRGASSLPSSVTSPFSPAFVSRLAWPGLCRLRAHFLAAGPDSSRRLLPPARLCHPFKPSLAGVTPAATPAEQVAEAFATSAVGHVVGKLVVSVKNDTAADSGGARPLGWGP